MKFFILDFWDNFEKFLLLVWFHNLLAHVAVDFKISSIEFSKLVLFINMGFYNSFLCAMEQVNQVIVFDINTMLLAHV